MATINDVCREAGVSKATVSRVVNGTGQVRESTRLKVQRAMDVLNYRPSLVAQALALQSTNSIGVMISDFNSRYLGSFLKQASISTKALGKNLIIADGHNCPEEELAAIRSLIEKKCDLIILNGSLLTDEQLISLNQQVDIPLVHIGRSLSADAGYSIAVDQRLLIETAVDHLVEIGHRNIVYVGPTSLTKASIERSSAFAEVVSQFQSLNVVGTQIECLLGFEEGYEACKQLLEQNVRFSAVIGATDEVAAGCMSALKEAGIDVPGQVSVMGTDNDSFGAFMSLL